MTSMSSHAFCTRLPVAELPTPSIVVMLLWPMLPMDRTHDRTATPSRCTVQAPHCAMPQPNLVPVIPSRSRSTHSNGTSGGASTVFDSPFIFRVIINSPQRPLKDCSPGRVEVAIPRFFSIFLHTQSRKQRLFYGLPDYCDGHEQLVTPRPTNDSGAGRPGGGRSCQSRGRSDRQSAQHIRHDAARARFAAQVGC